MTVCAPTTSAAHCCVIDGETCPAVAFDPTAGLYRCSMWDRIGTHEWQQLPVGLWFRENHPGYTCRDWPQNIPEVMAAGRGLCCWQGGD